MISMPITQVMFEVSHFAQSQSHFTQKWDPKIWGLLIPTICLYIKFVIAKPKGKPEN
jgi:hypothetical protein